VAVARNDPPRHRVPAGLCWVAGDTLYSWFNDVAGVSPYPSSADILYLAAYPLLAVCFALLIRARRRGRDVVGWIDAGIVTINLGLLAWVVVAGPIVRSGADHEGGPSTPSGSPPTCSGARRRCAHR
jgi:hypothetical protein